MTRLSKYILSFFLLSSSFPLWAVDRLGFMGTSFSPAYHTNPVREKSAMSYQIETGLFLWDRIAMTLAWRLDVNKIKTRSARTGLRWFLTREKTWIPFVDTTFVAQSQPSQKLGFSAGLGTEVDLVSVTDINNIRLVFSSSYSRLIDLNDPDIEYFDWLRAGLYWTF